MDSGMTIRRINPKIIAFHLPQFHPVAENNDWWGPGFTEWHNVAKARPLYRGHRQPNLPGELGFYDMRLAQTRQDQADLAREHGVHGFCYWHYWFGGRRLLEQPTEALLAEGRPNLPFCLGWANESWTGIWHGAPKSVLMEQSYPPGDAAAHYALLRRYFADPRYIKHDGKPLLYVYQPKYLPSDGSYLRELRRLATNDGYPDLFIAGTWKPNPGGRFDSARDLGLDAAIVTNLSGRDTQSRAHVTDAVKRRLLAPLANKKGPQRLSYARTIDTMLPEPARFDFPAYNTLISNWDNTPRSGRRGLVLTGSSPALFRQALDRALRNLAAAPAEQTPGDFIFLKSWNEWAEGNYVEPDQVHGRDYLVAIREALAAWA
jgi:hypothetical protein